MTDSFAERSDVDPLSRKLNIVLVVEPFCGSSGKGWNVIDHLKADLSERSRETGTTVAYLNIIVTSIILGIPTHHTGFPDGATIMLREGIIFRLPGSPIFHRRREFKNLRFSMIDNRNMDYFQELKKEVQYQRFR